MPLPVPGPQGRLWTWWTVPGPSQGGLSPGNASVPTHQGGQQLSSCCRSRGACPVRLSFPPSEQLPEATGVGAPACPCPSWSRCLSQTPRLGTQSQSPQHWASGPWGASLSYLQTPALRGPAFPLRGGVAVTEPSLWPALSLPTCSLCPTSPVSVSAA